MVLASGISASIATMGGSGLLLYLVFVLWMAADAAKSKKYVWLLFIFGMPLVGVVVYFFTEKEHDYMKVWEEGK